MLKYWVIAWIVDRSKEGRLAVWGGREWIRTECNTPQLSLQAMLSTKWRPTAQPYGYSSKRRARECAARLLERQKDIVRLIAAIPANHSKLEPLDIPSSLKGVHGEVCHEVVKGTSSGDL